jgi:hypothetical protein
MEMKMAKAVDPTLKELTAIRKLLVLGLLQSGLNQTQVAGALGVDRSQISRMFPAGTLTGIGGGSKTDEQQRRRHTRRGNKSDEKTDDSTVAQ